MTAALRIHLVEQKWSNPDQRDAHKRREAEYVRSIICVYTVQSEDLCSSLKRSENRQDSSDHSSHRNSWTAFLVGGSPISSNHVQRLRDAAAT